MESITTHEHFPTDAAGLPEAHAPRVLELANGDEVDLRIAPVAKRIGEANLRMLAYDGSIPGPLLRVRQGSELVVHVKNDGDLDTTVHWHGLRLDNLSDGTTLVQEPIHVGGGHSYRLQFPDAGVYWYHPHIREDYGQEMGLYGNIVVVPAETDYLPPVHRELALTLDDVFVEDGKMSPFHRQESSYTAMGRFGNVLLIDGEPAKTLDVRKGEVLRLYLTNTANTRVFDVRLPGARMKRVGGDSGRYEREELVESVILAPSERVIVDVQFSETGTLELVHQTPLKRYVLGTVNVRDEAASPLSVAFDTLREDPELRAERAALAPHLAAAPDKTLALVAEMDLGIPELPPGAELEYFCPMHPEVTSHEPGKCPKCSMKLLARARGEAQAPSPTHATHGAEDATPHAHGDGAHAHDTSGIEWEDDMLEVNRRTTPRNTRWKLVDRATGAEGTGIDWRFKVGERVKIRLVNEMDSDHPMHHPFHVHGAGRFLILARDGRPEANLVWKDTVLVPTGEVVDILLEVTNPGRWMAHCHIAEHHESGMMLRFDVDA